MGVTKNNSWESSKNIQSNTVYVMSHIQFQLVTMCYEGIKNQSIMSCSQNMLVSNIRQHSFYLDVYITKKV